MNDYRISICPSDAGVSSAAIGSTHRHSQRNFDESPPIAAATSTTTGFATGRIRPFGCQPRSYVYLPGPRRASGRWRASSRPQGLVRPEAGPRRAAAPGLPRFRQRPRRERNYQTYNGEAVAATGNGGGNLLYRLREGIERFLITDINNPGASARAQVPWRSCTTSLHQRRIRTVSGRLGDGTGVKKFNHLPGGSNVLYLDGHVAFIRYPGDFPITPWMAGYYASVPFGGGL